MTIGRCDAPTRRDARAALRARHERSKVTLPRLAGLVQAGIDRQSPNEAGSMSSDMT
jgi:hypothetical protein